jgi:UTP-glucose-1-phosphate uridylyltransferase/mevalonate kinase
MKLFVPGRICLFGEHSDWAGGYRRINGSLGRGLTLIAGTNQGIHAEVRPHATRLLFRSSLCREQGIPPLDLPMQRDALLAEAEKGGLYSYVAGVAYQVLTHYHVHGLEIDNFETDLPVRKGLSSSAAVSVLVARAFNRIYDLKMTVRGEMEFAYLGEITTPSRCGRMDQGCAYGSRPVLMSFDGDRVDVQELSVARDLHFVIVDLGAGKDTREILSKLNHCYPFAENDLQRGVQRYLGEESAAITREAAAALQRGDAEAVGRLMTRAQAAFDRWCAPACPSQLTAPVLHRMLAHPLLQPHILGGKGVGSQGDGSAQFIVRDAEAQAKVVAQVEGELGLRALPLVLRAARRVRKAVIPAAGFGTRLFPATKAVKKELFPVVDRDGRAKPAILAIVEEAFSAGVEQVCIIVQKADRPVFEELFRVPPPVEHLNKLSRESRRYCDYLLELGHRVHFVEQDSQEGFGHAVFSARDWVGEEPFLLLLGDHLYVPEADVSCARQLVSEYERCGRSVVGLNLTPGREVHHFGAVAGVWERPGETLALTAFCEKPDLEYAREHLRVEELEHDRFLTVFGLYVLTPRVFEFLAENIRHNLRERGEFQLTGCLDRLRREDGFTGCLVKGRRLDLGLPDSYLATLREFRRG